MGMKNKILASIALVILPINICFGNYWEKYIDTSIDYMECRKTAAVNVPKHKLFSCNIGDEVIVLNLCGDQILESERECRRKNNEIYERSLQEKSFKTLKSASEAMEDSNQFLSRISLSFEKLLKSIDIYTELKIRQMISEEHREYCKNEK
jgi:hypothetical protein